MTVIGIVTALPLEARALTGWRGAPRYAQDPVRLGTAHGEVLLAVSGVGHARAAATAAALLRAGAQALLAAGCAAGIDARLAPGDLVIPSRVVVDRACALPVCDRWHAALCARLAGGLRIHTAPLAHARRVLETGASKRALRLATGAIAADMESSAVAEVARAQGVPFLCVRAIADGSRLALPAAALAAVGDDGNVSAAKAIGGLLRSPRELLPLAALGAGFRRACATLHRVSASTGRAFCAGAL